jgi:hypothetical protein
VYAAHGQSLPDALPRGVLGRGTDGSGRRSPHSGADFARLLGCAVLSSHRGCTWRQPLGRIPRRKAAPPSDLPCHIDIWTDKTHDSGRWSGEVNTLLRDDVDINVGDTLDVFPA